jgi:MFS transporter, MFS domain-containing protein family, molybdate-anion transporter
MYIFVFYWSAAMESAHELSASIEPSPSSSVTARAAADSIGTETHIPFGVIFATFMAAMMLGSLLFSHLSSPLPSSLSNTKTNAFSRYIKTLHTSPSTLLTLAILLSSTSLLLPVLLKSESLTFWAFCIFEACIGVYYPSMGAQKGRIVDDGVRANIYGLLRIPLNIFVVVALTTTVEGDLHRDRVFVFCGGLLLAASVGAGWWLEDGDAGGSEVSEAEERVE